MTYSTQPPDIGAASSFVPPTREQIASCADQLHVPLSRGDVEECRVDTTIILNNIARLDDLDKPAVPFHVPERDPGRPPTTSEDPYNAIIRFCYVRRADTGPLGCMRIGVKDKISVAGVPLTHGRIRDSAPIPVEDAVVVERLLDAGAVITAKANIAGSVFGDTRNPHNPDFSPGYTSSGSAAAAEGKIVDAALGTDQAGSVRIPAAWRGLVGMKATHGLVPSAYGIGAHSTNQIGAITTTVAHNAAMLEVIAGPDWRNPESRYTRALDGDYANAASRGIERLRIGTISQAAQPYECTPRASEAFDHATSVLAGAGATIVPVSAPLWSEAATIDHWLGEDHEYRGRVDESLLAAMAVRHSPTRPQILALLVREHLRRRGEGDLHFARIQNLRIELRRQLDRVLDEVDLVVTPTTVVVPFKLIDELFATPDAAWTHLNVQLRNTAPPSLTGHPALTVPSGRDCNAMPTGLQIIGRTFDEHTVYRASRSKSFRRGRAVSMANSPSDRLVPQNLASR